MAIVERQTCPSREFLVRQAVLNAVNLQCPHSTRRDGPPAALRFIIGLTGLPPEDNSWFINLIRAEFSTLAAKYAEPTQLPGAGIK